MKTNAHSRPRRRQVLRYFIPVLTALCLVTSCSTTPKAQEVNPAPPSQWVKACSQPPTWYPRGTAANCVTDHTTGEWIYTEDAQGTRFFIPLHGLPADRRKTLLAEAFAARNPDKSRRIANEETGRKIATAVGIVVVAPFMALGSP